MERIVLWGAVKRTAMYFDWLYEKFEIVAIVSDKRQQESYHGIDIIGRDRIKDYDFDCSAIEEGVYRGRSAFFICAILAMKNRNLTYKMVDIYDRIDDFKLFKAKLPQLEKCIPSCSDDYKGQSFDFVFIDADHSYDASIRDFNNVGQYGKVVTAFHDIYAHEYDHENGGTVRMWQEVLDRTSDERHFVFSQYPDKWMGIGVVEWR